MQDPDDPIAEAKYLSDAMRAGMTRMCDLRDDVGKLATEYVKLNHSLEQIVEVAMDRIRRVDALLERLNGTE